MKKIISNILVASAAFVALATSCTKEFLDTAPTASVATADVFANVDNVKMAVNGLAYLMTTQHSAYSQGCDGENRIRSIYQEYGSQEFRYNQMAPGWAPIMNNEYYSRNTTTYSSYPWVYYYEIIADANSIICNVDKAEGSDEEKAFYKAQALTYRAYAYTMLMELYSVRWKDSNNGSADGVVLRLDESTEGMPLSSAAKCYEQIYKDCDDAVTNFNASGMDRGDGEVWLTNTNVAYAVKARAALNREDYQTALTNAKLAREGYPLMTNAEYKAGFCGPTSEWIFGSYGSAEENSWYWSFGTQFSCNGYYASASQYGAGDIEKELTDRMPKDDIRMGCFLTIDKLGLTNENYVSYTDGTYGYILDDDVWDAAAAYIATRTPSGLEPAYQSGYFYIGAQLKFWVFDTPGVSYLCFIRSSEMALIEAEANYFLGNEEAAQASLKQLNADSGRNPAYTCSKTGADLFQEIVDYRELELWGEGFNWYDIKRWNRDIVRKSFNEGGNCHTSTATTITAASSNWTWAIPECETLYNTEIKK